MTTTAVLQLHHREVFEKNVARALLAGAAAGCAQLLFARVHVPVPLAYLATAAAALACVRGDKWDRALLGVLCVGLTAVPWLLGLAPLWTLAVSGAVAGALMVRARLSARGEEGQVGDNRPGPLHYAVTAGLTGALACGGAQVVRILGARLVEVQTPALLAAAVNGAGLALFVALGSIAAHLALRPDPVEARCEELLPQLSGELQTLASRLLSLYRQCGASLAQLPRQPAREELARTLSRMTREAVELASEWTGVEAELEQNAHRELTEQIRDLEASAARAQDLVARRQLTIAAASLKEELTRVAELALRRERILAKLKSEVALLDRARIALLGMRSGHAQLKAAELSALARKLGALASAQGVEARMADAVATSAELTHQEADLAAAELEAAMAKPVPVIPAEPATEREEEAEVTPAPRASRLPLA